MTEPAVPVARIPRVVWGAAGAIVLLHLVLALGMRAPIVHPDEGSYLGAAHFFAFGEGLLNSAASYSPGYPVLLAPLARLLGDPMATYHGALVVNAVLHGTVVVTTYLLARRLVRPGEDGRAVVAGVLVALYAAFLLSGNLAMATSLMVAGVPAVLVLVARAWERPTTTRWALAGAAGVALVGVHPVGVVVAGAVGVAPLLGARRAAVGATARRFASTVAGGAAVAVVVALLVDLTRRHTTVARHVGARGSATGGAQSRVGYTAGQVRDALGFSNPRGLLVAASGQVLYLVVATFGLVLVGMVVAARNAPRGVRDPDASAGTRLAFLAGLVLLGSVVASVLVINPPRDASASALLYGRYNDQVVGPVLLLGLLGLPAVVRDRRRMLVAVGGVAAVVVACVAVILLAWPGASHLDLLELGDVLGVFAVVNGLGRLDVFRLGVVLPVLALVGVAGFGLLVLAQRRGGTRALAVVAGLGFLVPALLAGVVIVRSSANRARQDVLVGAIRSATDGGSSRRDCVAYLPAVEASWWLANYEFRLPDRRFEPLAAAGDAGAVPPGPCARLVLATGDDPAVAALGLEPIASERVDDPYPITLYRMPGSR